MHCVLAYRYAFDSPEGGHVILFDPTDDTVRVREGCVEVTAHKRLKHEKIGMDSSAGWMAYLSRRDTLFVKRFSVETTRVYGEMAGLTCCVFYYRCALGNRHDPLAPSSRVQTSTD